MEAIQSLPNLSEKELSSLGTAEATTDYVSPQGETYDDLALVFPQRPGPRPTTTDDEPHEQLDQLGSEELWDEMHRRAFALPGVREDRSGYSFPETRALWLEPEIHPVTGYGVSPANSLMLYSPRNPDEMEVVWSLVEESYRYATGQPQKFKLEPRPKETP
jgi:hypothetical protein